MDSPLQSDDDLGDSVSADVVCVFAQSDHGVVIDLPDLQHAANGAEDAVMNVLLSSDSEHVEAETFVDRDVDILLSSASEQSGSEKENGAPTRRAYDCHVEGSAANRCWRCGLASGD